MSLIERIREIFGTKQVKFRPPKPRSASLRQRIEELKCVVGEGQEVLRFIHGIADFSDELYCDMDLPRGTAIYVVDDETTYSLDCGKIVRKMLEQREQDEIYDSKGRWIPPDRYRFYIKPYWGEKHGGHDISKGFPTWYDQRCVGAFKEHIDQESLVDVCVDHALGSYFVGDSPDNHSIELILCGGFLSDRLIVHKKGTAKAALFKKGMFDPGAWGPLPTGETIAKKSYRSDEELDPIVDRVGLYIIEHTGT
ncbi:hypothetical protein HYX11_01470 [Candidatus Woesearchaeota archaeon]|nr:hypothetical protein [Candidatus Woesearchaeota archaeon]